MLGWCKKCKFFLLFFSFLSLSHPPKNNVKKKEKGKRKKEKGKKKEKEKEKEKGKGKRKKRKEKKRELGNLRNRKESCFAKGASVLNGTPFENTIET